MTAELAEGWALAPLGEVVLLVMGQSPPGSTYNREGRGLPFFQGKADFGARFPTPRVWCTSPSRLARPGDVLISVRAPVGPTNIADRQCAIGRGLAAIRPLGGMPTEWILHAVSFARPSLEAQATGSTFTAVKRAVLEGLEIPMAPLAEQRRIVAAVEALLERVNAARERLAKVTAILKRFRQAVLAGACSGRLTEEWRIQHGSYTALATRPPSDATKVELENVPELPEMPDDWQLATIRDVATELRYGANSKADAERQGAIPILRMGNVQNGQLDLSDLKYVPRQGTEEFRLCRGDVLFNRTNSPELVGKAAVFDRSEEMVHASYLIRIRTAPDRLVPEFVCSWLNSPWGRAWARAVRTDGVSQSNINAAKLAAMPVPLPPLEEQQEIVRRVDALFGFADAVERRVAGAKARAERVTQSILAKAFRGEFVPTEAELARREGREYEPAGVLLERIRREGEAARNKS